MADSTTPTGSTDLSSIRSNPLGFLSSLFQGLAGGQQSNPFGGLGQGTKSKKAPQQPASKLPSLANVPTATGNFYQGQSPDQKMALLQAMIQRAKQPTGMFPGGPPSPAVSSSTPTQVG